MADGSGAAGARYRAFISYSHRDALFAARLHRRLEGYVLPKRLGVERRLTPIFKDREELPAAHDLSAQVRAALEVSDCLIVVCSPDAAASPWVGREIELFRELHPDRPILAALVRGEPAEAFPPALAAGGVEPLAADFRKEGDGERLALLKLVAGMSGVGVDQLIQRDAQRRLQSVMAVTAVFVAATLVMSGMTLFAMSARSEAERQRAGAEDLVEFMLTDLRQELKGVGSLAPLEATNARALAYYSRQPLNGLPVASLQRRARVLMAMGEDQVERGKLDPAMARFHEASAVTERLLSQRPDDPERIFTHAQSTYWFGRVAHLKGDRSSAMRAFNEYRALAAKLARLSPDNPRYRKEPAFADAGLCAIAVDLTKNADDAVKMCRSALDGMRLVVSPQPTRTQDALDLANRYSWLAQAYELAGNDPAVADQLASQIEVLKPLQVREPDNAAVLDQWAAAQRTLSRRQYRKGRYREALRHAVESRDSLKRLTVLEPANQRWRERLQLAEAAVRITRGALGSGPSGLNQAAKVRS